MAALFEAKTGVKIEMTFNNSGTLVGQLIAARKGDLFIPGSRSFIDKAAEQGLIATSGKAVAYHVPVIIVPKANPAGIGRIEDFARPGTKLLLPDRKATALGKSIFMVFDRLGIAEAASANVRAFLETPQKVVAALSLGQGDAGIVDFSAVASRLDVFAVIEIDPEVNVVEELPCAVLSCGTRRNEALAFMRFMESEGPAVFGKHGFRTSR